MADTRLTTPLDHGKEMMGASSGMVSKRGVGEEVESVGKD